MSSKQPNSINVVPFLDPSLPPSEDTIATAFTIKHGRDLKFDHDQGGWFRWNGSHWVRDKLNLAFHYAREEARSHGKGTRALAKATAAGGVERFARAHPVHAVRADRWDQDPMVLGTPAGTVDLRTGKLRAPARQDFITMQTSVAPEAGEPVLWLKFLHEALDGDDGAIRFLQQWFGYVLTGLTTEHALLFLYGPGGNGKSVTIETQAAILGDYATTAPMETFAASKGERHPTELAMLRGARLVTATETEEGRAWNEARVKQLTGGDRVSARFMRQDFFTFEPRFKLTIAGNFSPVLHSVDDAMRRRLNILPFVTCPANPDPLLLQKLREEHGMILTWMIQGCLDWQRAGLVRPAIVAEATSEYFDDQDLFGQWLAERCDMRAGDRSLIEVGGRLFADWQQYAQRNGEAPGTQRSFAGSLQKRGIRKDRKRFQGAPQRIYVGIALKHFTLES